jgi:hypothetical protein
MTTPTRGVTRIARAAAFGVATLTLATVAHVSAGGATPSVLVLTGLSLPVIVMALILTSRRCGPLALLGVLAAGQVILHEALMTLSSHGSGEFLTSVAGAQHAAHTVMTGPMSAHAAAAIGFAPGGTMAGGPMASVPMASAGDWSLPMMAVHAVATILTALLLARGEQALWRLVARLLPTLLRIPRVLSCGPRQTPVLLSVPAVRPSLVSCGSGLRGPPAGFPAAA